jgi:undecaprenyl-diphosphatase
VIDGRVKKEVVLHALLACVVAWAIAEMIKTFFPTIRPFVFYGKLPLTITIPFDSAFPSQHETVSIALATTVWYHNKKIGTAFIVAAILVGAGRVLANVHYPLDILGGGLLGFIVATLIERAHLFSLLKKKKS